MGTTTGEVNFDCRGLPEIKPFRPFAKFREKYQQLERVVQAARKRGEQLRESITPIAARVATRAGSAAPAKAAPKPSSNKRVNTLRRITAEAAQHRKANRPAARKTNAAPAHTRRRAHNTAQPRSSDKPSAPSGNSERSASSASKTDSAKNGKA